MGIIVDILSSSHFEIRDQNTIPIVPSHVIFRELNYDLTKGSFIYSRKDQKVLLTKLQSKFSNPLDMMHFIANTGKISKKQDNQPMPEVRELDFSVHEPSYVVVSIKPSFNWAFDPRKKGITLGSEGNMDCYERLLHYDGTQLSGQPVVGCRHLVFLARALPPNTAGGDTEQPVNFNLVDASGTQVTVDPDIRYPGNTGLTEGDPEP